MNYTVEIRNRSEEITDLTMDEAIIDLTMDEAIELAEFYAHSRNNVFITWYRKEDGQHGYLNKVGYELNRKSLVEY